jgi:glycine/D-amino acid oxidase-like deaminating enzyme
MFAGKAWTKEVLHQRLAELKQVESTVANTIALYIEAHRDYLIAMFRSFSPEMEGSPDEDEVVSAQESKQKNEREKRIEAQFAEWREGEYAKLEGWVHPNNFQALLAKAKAEAGAEEEELKAAEEQGQGGGQAQTAQELFAARTSVLLDRVNEVRRELEEKGRVKMRELREEFMEPKGPELEQHLRRVRGYEFLLRNSVSKRRMWLVVSSQTT